MSFLYTSRYPSIREEGILRSFRCGEKYTSLYGPDIEISWDSTAFSSSYNPTATANGGNICTKTENVYNSWRKPFTWDEIASFMHNRVLRFGSNEVKPTGVKLIVDKNVVFRPMVILSRTKTIINKPLFNIIIRSDRSIARMEKKEYKRTIDRREHNKIRNNINMVKIIRDLE